MPKLCIVSRMLPSSSRACVGHDRGLHVKTPGGGASLSGLGPAIAHVLHTKRVGAHGQGGVHGWCGQWMVRSGSLPQRMPITQSTSMPYTLLLGCIAWAQKVLALAWRGLTCLYSASASRICSSVTPSSPGTEHNKRSAGAYITCMYTRKVAVRPSDSSWQGPKPALAGSHLLSRETPPGST